MKITIRSATPSDINTIFDIRTSVKENSLSHEQLNDMGITPDAIAQAITAAPCCWVAEVDEVIAAFAMADIEEGSVFALFVRPECEGYGVGRLLMAKAEAFLFTQHQTIWLETSANSRASGFYRQLGWLAVQELPDGDMRFEKHLS